MKKKDRLSYFQQFSNSDLAKSRQPHQRSKGEEKKKQPYCVTEKAVGNHGGRTVSRILCVRSGTHRSRRELTETCVGVVE